MGDPGHHQIVAAEKNRLCAGKGGAGLSPAFKVGALAEVDLPVPPEQGTFHPREQHEALTAHSHPVGLGCEGVRAPQSEYSRLCRSGQEYELLPVCLHQKMNIVTICCSCLEYADNLRL